MSKEIQKELLKLRDKGMILRGLITNGCVTDAFSTKPDPAENSPIIDLEPETENFVIDLEEKVVKGCCGFSKNNKEGYGEIFIDLADGKARIIMNWAETDLGAIDYTYKEEFRANCDEIVSFLNDCEPFAGMIQYLREE